MTHHLAQPHVRANVVLPDRDTILLIRCAGGWDLPSVAMQTGETLQQAGRRAVLEATGVAVALTNLVGMYSDARPLAATRLRIVFTAFTTPDRAKPGQGITELHWFNQQEAQNLPESELADPHMLQRILADVARGTRFPLGMLIEPGED